MHVWRYMHGFMYECVVHGIYIYFTFTFSRRFYPKRLTLHSSYSFYILSALAFPGNRTHDLSVASAMLYQLSYRKAVVFIYTNILIYNILSISNEHCNSQREVCNMSLVSLSHFFSVQQSSSRAKQKRPAQTRLSTLDSMHLYFHGD